MKCSCTSYNGMFTIHIFIISLYLYTPHNYPSIPLYSSLLPPLCLYTPLCSIFVSLCTFFLSSLCAFFFIIPLYPYNFSIPLCLFTPFLIYTPLYHPYGPIYTSLLSLCTFLYLIIIPQCLFTPLYYSCLHLYTSSLSFCADMEFVKKFTQARFVKTNFYPKERKSQ